MMLTDLQAPHHMGRARGVIRKRKGWGMNRRWQRAHFIVVPRWTQTNGPPHLLTLQLGAWVRPHFGHFQPYRTCCVDSLSSGLCRETDEAHAKATRAHTTMTAAAVPPTTYTGPPFPRPPEDAYSFPPNVSSSISH